MAVDEKDKRMLRAFGVRLGACRIAAGYADGKDAALDLAIEPPRYRKYERGQAIPPVPVLASICRLFDTTADFLLFGHSPRTRPAPAEPGAT